MVDPLVYLLLAFDEDAVCKDAIAAGRANRIENPSTPIDQSLAEQGVVGEDIADGLRRGVLAAPSSLLAEGKGACL